MNVGEKLVRGHAARQEIEAGTAPEVLVIRCPACRDDRGRGRQSLGTVYRTVAAGLLLDIHRHRMPEAEGRVTEGSTVLLEHMAEFPTDAEEMAAHCRAHGSVRLPDLLTIIAAVRSARPGVPALLYAP